MCAHCCGLDAVGIRDTCSLQPWRDPLEGSESLLSAAKTPAQKRQTTTGEGANALDSSWGPTRQTQPRPPRARRRAVV